MTSRKFLEKRLAAMARRVLARQQPRIVGVTGSVGKSSAKQAIHAVLRAKFDARASIKSYNNDLGLPLTILGLESGGRSALRWLGVLWRGFWSSWSRQKDYPSTLILEMAADRPGDIKRLAKLARPTIAVVTAVGESHGEYLGDREAIMREKRALVEALGKDGVAVLNRDDEMVSRMAEKSRGRVVSYGFDPEAAVRAHELSMQVTCDPKGRCGMSFKLSAGGSTVPVFLPYVLGRHAVYAALAAAAVGIEYGMNLVEIGDALSAYEPPPGRMRFIIGIKNTVLIDDTYNAAPKSVEAAIEALRDLPAPEGASRYAVLGDMLELGAISEEAHRKVGEAVAAAGVDVLVAVGELMSHAKEGALAAGMRVEQVYHFADAAAAGRFVQDRLRQDDVVLAKGSQGMRMERVVKELMADPLNAASLLCRQGSEWEE